MEIPFSDLPDWAQQAAARHLPGRRPRTHVKYVETVSFGSVWHDACRRIVITRDQHGRINHLQSGYYDSYVNHTAEERAVYEGGQVQLTPDRTIIEILSYPRRVTVFMHPSNAPKAITAPEQVLSDDEDAVLRALCGLTSAGRKDLWRRCNVPRSFVEQVTQSLADKGLVKIASNGAVRVTRDGRNVRSGIKPRFDDGGTYLREKFGW